MKKPIRWIIPLIVLLACSPKSHEYVEDAFLAGENIVATLSDAPDVVTINDATLALTLDAGGGADLVTVNGLSVATTINLGADNARDRIIVVDTSAPLQIEGLSLSSGGGVDTLTVDRSATTAAVTGSLQDTASGVLSGVTDADITFDGKRNVLLKTSVFSVDPHAGLELDYNRLVFLRMGMGNMKMITEFDRNESFDFQQSLSIGIHFRNITVDYALTDLGDQSIALYSNIFSLRYSFDLPGKKSRN